MATRMERQLSDISTRGRGFTLIELLVVIAIIALLIGILLPALGKARESGQKAVNGSNQRSTLSSMTIFAGDNNGYFPGVDQPSGNRNKIFTDASEIDDWTISGDRAGMHVPARFLLLLQDEYLTAEVLKSPAEPGDALPDYRLDGETLETVRASGNTLEKPVWVDYEPGGWEKFAGIKRDYTLQTVFYSYALLDLINEDAQDDGTGGFAFGPLCRSWSADASSMTPILSDRLTFWTQNAETQYNAVSASPENFAARDQLRQSLWTGEKGQGWQGNIAFGDGHVDFSNTSVLQATEFAGKVNTGANNKSTNNNSGDLDRSGDDLFHIGSGYTMDTQDAGMVVGWGSQTFRHGSAKNQGTR